MFNYSVPMRNLLWILALPVSSKTPVPAFGKMYNCLTIEKSCPLYIETRRGRKPENNVYQDPLKSYSLMKQKEKSTLSRRITLRFKPQEFENLNRFYKTTTDKKLSQYARKVLLKKPVTLNHRNQSADEILAELIQIKNELNTLGNNYNQVVKKLHTLENVTEIKTWLLLNEPARQRFIIRVEQIKERMNQLYEIWSQE